MWPMLDLLLSLFVKPKRTLHGFDLDKWHYLGFTRINFVGDIKTNVPVLGEADAFFFCNKENLGIRRYNLITINTQNGWEFEKDHHWGVEVLPLWQAGEGHIASNIHTPSDFLKEYLLETEGVIYDPDTKSWYNVGTKPPKYNKKKTKSESFIKKEEDNVVTVDFNKDKDDK